MTIPTKKIKVKCPYCGDMYWAHNRMSRYGCPKYECNLKGEREKEEYHNMLVAKRYHRKKAGGV